MIPRYDAAAALLDKVNLDRADAALVVAAAQVHALLAVAEAIEASAMPAEPVKPPVPFEQTREGWTWETP